MACAKSYQNMSQVQQLPGALQDAFEVSLTTKQLRTAALGVAVTSPGEGVGSQCRPH